MDVRNIREALTLPLLEGDEPFGFEAMKKKALAGGRRPPPVHDDHLYEL